MASPVARNPTSEPSPLDRWLAQALRNLFDPVLHEALPANLKALLPPAEARDGRASV